MTAWRTNPVYSFPGPLTDEDGNVTGETQHNIYMTGEGPPIILLQELPGIDIKTHELAESLAGNGFKVYLPHLLGRYNAKDTARNTLRLLCIRREFNMFARGKQSPIAGWMRAFAQHVSDREGGARVGVIGMCLTGSFALTLMAEDAVHGAVASQPALPIAGGNNLHMSEAEIAAARAGMQAKGKALAMRYQEDSYAPESVWKATKTAFDGLLELHEPPGKKHSLLTHDLDKDAHRKMMAYFKARFGLN